MGQLAMSEKEEKPKEKAILVDNSQGNQSKSEVIQKAKEVLRDVKNNES